MKAKKVMKRNTWNEKVKEHTGKDPMVCPKCECYYEYKGEACLQDGKFTVKYAVCKTSRACLEMMISHVTGVEETKSGQEKEKAVAKLSNYLLSKESVNYICLSCEEAENIPLSVVENFDVMDGGDPEIPPQFSPRTPKGVFLKDKNLFGVRERTQGWVELA
ncbi:hypothetical protein [Paenibacillus sp. SI8]|uniref:hypothetical protein n=1 Tax=unclassified Paenibacillus TaxID=185978 RepID=UPI0034666C9C